MDHIKTVIDRILPQMLEANPMTNYKHVTKRIIAQLQKGTVPWKSPYLAEYGLPRNLASGRLYRGTNIWLLASAPYKQPYWVTFKQAQSLGGHVRKGEKGTQVVKFGIFEPEDDMEELAGKMYLKLYTVFNVEQTSGLSIPEVPARLSRDDSVRKAALVVGGMPKRPQIRHSGLNRPCYSLLEDVVRMPLRSSFYGLGYHQTLFHELVHATGHGSRLGRLTTLSKNRHERLKEYSFEELVAELGAAYLSAHCGLDATHEQSAAYIEGWSKRLSEKENVAWVVRASRQAQKAVDYIIGRNVRNE